jgi:hypothetical protein
MHGRSGPDRREIPSTRPGDPRAALAIVAYWHLPLLLFALQALFTLRSTGQILYEELAESVRNPYWVHHRVVYDPISTNVGWYGTLLAIYRSFGFTLDAGRWFRLLLQLPSLLCVAWLLQRHLGRRAAWVPLLALGLSPSLLFFTSSLTSIGIDLQYAPIALALLASLHPARPWTSALAASGAGALSMLAWMSYPTFAFHLPALALLTWSRLRSAGAASRRLAAAAAAGFLLPFVAAFAFIENRAVLAAGIFRAGGRELSLAPGTFLSTLGANLRDLLIADSYHFRLHAAELSGGWPLLAVGLVLAAAGWLALGRRIEHRRVLLAAWLVLALGLLGPSLAPAVPGLRRITPALGAFYVLFAIVWSEALRGVLRPAALRVALRCGLLLLPLHHALVYAANLAHASDPSGWQADWFRQVPSPSGRLRELTDQAVRGGLQLFQRDAQGRYLTPRYTEVYAAVAGACAWNELDCKQITAWDAATGTFRPPADRPPE